jgi:hypothetical protein
MVPRDAPEVLDRISYRKVLGFKVYGFRGFLRVQQKVFLKKLKGSPSFHGSVKILGESIQQTRDLKKTECRLYFLLQSLSSGSCGNTAIRYCRC